MQILKSHNIYNIRPSIDGYYKLMFYFALLLSIILILNLLIKWDVVYKYQSNKISLALQLIIHIYDNIDIDHQPTYIN